MKKIILALAFVFLFSTFVFAQKTLPTPPPLDEDVVKISTTLIQIDVTVTDKKGNPVRDLKPEEIEIYENGKKQDISNFSFISSVREKTVETPKNNKEQTNIPIPPPQVRPEQVRRTIALVVDDLTLSFESTYYVRRALKKFVDEQMLDGDLVAIIRTGAGIGALQQFTTDKRQLYAAIEKVRWNPIGNGGIGAFAPVESSLDDAANQSGTETDDQDDANSPVSDLNSFRESVFATGTLGAINYVVRGMQELPGRKSVMLFSDGFALFTKDSNGFTDSARVLDSLKKLVDAANRASVVIYTMDARGLQVTGLTAADDVSGKSADQIEQSLSDRRTKLFDTQEGLTYLAKQTGGISIINNNDLSGGVRKMLDDQSYYLIGYQPEDEVFDPQKRRFNKLEVKVKRDGVKVRYRSGFFGVSDEEIAARPKESNLTPKQKIANALTSPFAANEIPLRLNALFGNDEKQGSFIRSFLHINAENITFTDAPDGKKKATFDILAVGFGDNGIPIETISKAFTANIDEDTYKLIKEKGLIYDFLFPVKKAGAYQLRVAIYDGTSGKVGSANQFVEVPNIKKNRLTLSGIVVENILFEEWEKMMNGKKYEVFSNPVGDTALRQFKIGTVINYGLVIYNAKSASNAPDLTSRLRVFKDGKLLFEGKSQPVISSGAKDLKRINATGSLSLGTNMEEGDYVLQIVVTDNQAKKKQQTVSQFVPFEIIK